MAWPLDTGDNREARHSRTQTDLADLPSRNEADFVEPEDEQEPRASLVYVAFETFLILLRSLRQGQVITGSFTPWAGRLKRTRRQGSRNRVKSLTGPPVNIAG